MDLHRSGQGLSSSLVQPYLGAYHHIRRSQVGQVDILHKGPGNAYTGKQAHIQSATGIGVIPVGRYIAVLNIVHIHAGLDHRI